MIADYSRELSAIYSVLRTALSQWFTSHNFRNKAVFGGYILGFKCENEFKYASILLYSVKFSKLTYSYLVSCTWLET